MTTIAPDNWAVDASPSLGAPASRVPSRILLLLPDGFGVRNLVLGPLLDVLKVRDGIDVMHALSGELVSTYAGGAKQVDSWRAIPAYREAPITFLLRAALGYAHLFWVRTRAMRATLAKPVRGSWRTRVVHGIARLVGRVAAFPAGIRALDIAHERSVRHRREVDACVTLLQTRRPSVLLCSHQRPPEIVPMVLAARRLDIPTVTMIFSWDNLSSKARIAVSFDHYFVWSDHMKRELLRFYPDVSESRVHVVGAVQFDSYARTAIIESRSRFFEGIGADPEQPLICYSGGDRRTSAEDPRYVRILLEGIRTGRIAGNPLLLLRPAPVDDGGRFDAVRREFPELLYARPQWVGDYGAGWNHVAPLPEDIAFMANLTRHADVNVNLASTMTLDFALHDRPVVNVAFDPGVPRFGVPMWEHYYRFEHYRPVVELGAARFARSPEELYEHVNAYLADPSLDRDGRRRLVEMQVGAPIGEASRRIASALASIVGSA